MQPEIEVNTGSFQYAVERYRRATLKDIEIVLLRGFSGFTRRLIGITPPADGQRGEGGRLTSEDKKRGESAIRRDLGILFQALAKKLAKLATDDPAAIHADVFARRKIPGKALRSPLGQGRKYLVDPAALKALTRQLIARVGYTASGWLAGALLVKGSGIPQWVRRHGTGAGTATLVRNNYATTFFIANNSVPTKLAPEMQRRLQTALGYTADALERETQAILARRNPQLARAA